MAPAFALVDPFEIDDGELDGLGAVDAFVLGAEWAGLRSRLTSEAARFTATIHAANEGRILRLLRRHGRAASARQLDPTWTELVVLPRVYQ